MEMAEATRPKPKVRAKPVPRRKISSKDSKSPSLPPDPVEDEDAFFIRRRTEKQEKELEKQARLCERKRQKSLKRQSASDSEESDSSNSDGRKKGKKRRPFVAKPRELPSWAKDGVIELSSDSDNDKEDDASSAEEQTVPQSGAAEAVASIEISDDEVEVLLEDDELDEKRRRAQETARTHLGMAPMQDSSATYDTIESDSDVETEDPALAAIKAAAHKRALERVAQGDSSNKHEVQITIKLMPHPQDKDGASTIYNFDMCDDDAFTDCFNEVADASSISSDKLVVTHNGLRVFSTSTPRTLSIWKQGILEAYSRVTYDYIKSMRQRSISVEPVASSSYVRKEDNFRPALNEIDEDDEEFSPSLTQPSVQVQPKGGSHSQPRSQDKEDAFRLQVRIGEDKTTVTVRPTTACERIVAVALKKMKQSDPGGKARIEVDGEQLDPKSLIGDADLDDGDLIDIVGL